MRVSTLCRRYNRALSTSPTERSTLSSNTIAKFLLARSASRRSLEASSRYFSPMPSQSTAMIIMPNMTEIRRSAISRGKAAKCRFMEAHNGT